jgi:hypothetical protein
MIERYNIDKFELYHGSNFPTIKNRIIVRMYRIFHFKGAIFRTRFQKVRVVVSQGFKRCKSR